MAQHSTTTATNWDTSYEWKTVALLGVGFGLVGLDRWIIASLFPAMAMDLGLPEGEIGRLAGILGILWGVFAIFSGRLSDAIGHRKVLIPAIVLFSLMSGFSGMVQSLVALVWIRAIMGAMEGTYCPTSFTAVAAASKPAAARLQPGLAAERLRADGLCARADHRDAAPERRAVVALGVLDLRDSGLHRRRAAVLPAARAEGHASRRADRCDAGERLVARSAEDAEHPRLHGRAVVRDGVRVRARRDGADLSHERAAARRRRDVGLVASALGFGGFFGQFGWPGLSDRFGRKPLAILGFIGATASVWWFANTGAAVLPLFVALFVCSFFCLGNVALITGPIATESAPRGLISSAIGVVVGAGEIFGGGVAPIIAGGVTDRYGLPSALNVALVGVALGIVVCFFLRETAPSKTGASAPQAA